MSIVACSVDGCELPHYGKTWCNKHYNRMRNTGRLDLKPKATNYCKVETCGVELVPPYGRGMCSLHYKRFMKYGDVHYQRPLIVGVAECTIDGCSGIIQARGWCSKHLTRWDRYGDPLHRYGYEVVDGKRVCPGCKLDRPLGDYSPGSTGRCKPCVAANMQARREINPPPLRQKVTLTCMCGSTFDGDKRRHRYCSEECFLGNRHKANWKHANKRRMRLRRAFVESFDRVEIFERDGWICQLCMEPTVRGAAWPNQLMPSLDHIIPVSKGGKHSRANAQTSHLGCNIRKGAKLTS